MKEVAGPVALLSVNAVPKVMIQESYEMAISKSARWSILVLLLFSAAIFYRTDRAAAGMFAALAMIFEFCILAGILKVQDKIE